MIDIVMLSCNRARLTGISIQEIAKRTTTPYHLTVVDNGSIDESPEILSHLRDAGLIHRLVLSEENTGVHWGFNQLLEMVESSPYYICTDADLIPCVPIDRKDWLYRLIILMERSPDYGAIACRPHILIGEPANRFDNCPEIREMSHIGAHLRIMDTELVREVGGWKKSKAPSRNNEDWFIGGRIRKAGRKVGYSRDIRCIHQFGDREQGEDPWGYPVLTLPVENDIPIRDLLLLHEPFPGIRVEVFVDGKLEKDHKVVVTPSHEIVVRVFHGHVPRWPPVDHYSWNRQGIDWETCER
jgi:GT2 family glycosyltransferase